MWCVFDVDEYWKENKNEFKKAINKAFNNDINLAWSNESFELWFLLHFNQLTTPISRNDYNKKLKDLFKKKFSADYKKNMNGVYNLLSDFQAEAIKNAKIIFKNNKIEKNPSTAVFLLIEEIFKNSK